MWAGLDAPPLLGAVLRADYPDRLATLLHQLAFYHSALFGKAVLGTRSAVTRIVQACACSAVDLPEADRVLDEEPDNDDENWEGAVWTTEALLAPVGHPLVASAPLPDRL